MFSLKIVYFTLSIHLLIFFFTCIGFTVRLLGNHIKLAQLETPTMMILDPFPPLGVSQIRNDTDTTKKKCQYEPVFMQLADENRFEILLFFICIYCGQLSILHFSFL